MKSLTVYCLAALQLAALSHALPALAIDKSARAHDIFADPAVMARAFPKGGVKPADATDIQVIQARDLAAKTLGEDIRDLVFIPVTPCTVWDTRFATNAPFMGAIGPGVTRQFYSHLDSAGGNFTPYGGNPSCAEANQTFLGGRPYAAMMTVYVNNTVGQGWLTFYRDGDADPSQATISVYYSSGPTRTQTVISKSGRGYGAGTYDVAVTGRFSTADASASVVGYFIKPLNITLTASTATSGNILKGASRFIHNFGIFNTFIGENAGNFTMTGTANTANGANSFINNTTGAANTAIGLQALFLNTTGSSNTADGSSALANNTTGSSNTASGSSALQGNTTGDYNTASGWSALAGNETGYFNTANGAGALQNNATGIYNTASGADALLSNTSGNFNTACGSLALLSNMTGSENTASGRSALINNTIGIQNTANGLSALALNTSGNSNIAIGYAAGFNLTTGHYNIVIGNYGVTAEGNTIRIGDANQTRAFIAGIRSVTTGAADAIPVLIDSNGQLGTVSSSRRFKDDIADMSDTSAALMKLRPVTFHYKSDQNPAGRSLQYGLIAEEVAQVYPGLVAHSSDGQIETVMYQFLPTMLLNEVQKQQRTIEAQAASAKMQVARIAELEQDRKMQMARMDALEKQAAKVAALEQQAVELTALKQLTTKMAATLDQLQRSGMTTAGLQLK